MDLFTASAYAVVSAYAGFVLGVLVRGPRRGRRPPGGGEGPMTPPDDPGPEDWAQWEDELRGAAVH